MCTGDEGCGCGAEGGEELVSAVFYGGAASEREGDAAEGVRGGGGGGEGG